MKDARDELVRIDVQGQAHPIGVTASQRLRAREGIYRMLPAPAHVVFMRLTGEDGRRDAEDGAVVRLAGEVGSPGAMTDVLALVAQAGWRGELMVSDGEVGRSIFLDQGNVVGVTTSSDAERLGSVLYRYGMLDERKLEQIFARVRQGRRLGDAAVELGFLTKDQVYKGIRRQIEEVVFATLTLSDGTFFFLEGFDAMRLVSAHAVSANALLMDGVTRMDELRYFRQKIPSSDYVPVRLEGRAPPAAEFATVYAAIDGKSNIEEIGRVSGLGEFETTKQCYALAQSKHIGIHPPRLSGGPAAVVSTANGALQAVFAAASESGKLEELRESLDSFAVGAGVYDILFRRAGPDENGQLDVNAVAENAIVLSEGADAEQVLKQLLHEYVSFALFSVGGTVGPERESELKKQVGPFLNALSPQA
jgi:hypothetical protein